jgi:hypothetical protein
MFAKVRWHVRRYMQLDSSDGNPGLYEKLRILLDSPGLQAVLVYRFGSWVERAIHFALIRYPLKLIYYILQKLCIIC